MSMIHLQSPAASAKKLVPRSSSIPVPFSYEPSKDGIDENLLILLHGLGDTHLPFSRLGRSLNLPQTATLALRALEQVPFLYTESYQWYPSFTSLGELVPSPNPTPAISILSTVIDTLIRECGWMDKRIHLLGFAQGGTVAAEFVLEYWKRSIRAAQERGNDGDELAGSLGSVISISGPLISYPTLSKPTSTPLLIFHRPPPSQSALLPADLKALQKAYTAVTEVNGGNGEGMPRSKEEWEPIMRFWSTKLGRRLGEDLYEFMGGRAP